MKKEVFDKFIGEKISILLDNLMPNGRRESYVGEIKENGDDYICLILSQDYDRPNPVMAIYVKHSLIISVWIYNDQKK